MSNPAAPVSGATAAPHPAKGRRLSRAQDGRPAAPVRIVHLGLGNFFRAPQCWFTENCLLYTSRLAVQVRGPELG